MCATYRLNYFYKYENTILLKAVRPTFFFSPSTNEYTCVCKFSIIFPNAFEPWHTYIRNVNFILKPNWASSNGNRKVDPWTFVTRDSFNCVQHLRTFGYCYCFEESLCFFFSYVCVWQFNGVYSRHSFFRMQNKEKLIPSAHSKMVHFQWIVPRQIQNKFYAPTTDCCCCCWLFFFLSTSQ